MTRNERIIDNIVSGTTVTLEIDLTGKEVRALRRVVEERRDNTETNYQLSNLLLELEGRYEEHVERHPITVQID